MHFFMDAPLSRSLEGSKQRQPGYKHFVPTRVAPNFGETQGRSRHRGLWLQSQLPIADVVPSSHLVTYLAVDADTTKPDRFVQPNAARIRQCNAGIRVVIALCCQDAEQRCVQSLAHSPPPKIGVYVDRRVYRPLVRVAFGVSGRISVAGKAIAEFADQPGIALERSFNTTSYFPLAWRLDLERDWCRPDDRLVDFSDSGRIIDGRHPQFPNHGLSSTSVFNSLDVLQCRQARLFVESPHSIQKMLSFMNVIKYR